MPIPHGDDNRRNAFGGERRGQGFELAFAREKSRNDDCGAYVWEVGQRASFIETGAAKGCGFSCRRSKIEVATAVFRWVRFRVGSLDGPAMRLLV